MLKKGTRHIRACTYDVCPFVSNHLIDCCTVMQSRCRLCGVMGHSTEVGACRYMMNVEGMTKLWDLYERNADKGLYTMDRRYFINKRFLPVEGDLMSEYNESYLRMMGIMWSLHTVAPNSYLYRKLKESQ